MKLGYSDGPVSSLEVRNVEADWERIAERLIHRAGPKDGSYLVRGPCAPERRDCNLLDAHLLVLSFATNDPLHVTRNGKPTYLDAWDAAQRLV